MKIVKAFLVVIILSLGQSNFALAQSSSTNYSVEESSFSSGSGSGSSASYQAQISAGDLGVGSANSTTYRAYAGPISPNEEYLEMVVTATTINLDTPSSDPGILSDAETAFGSGNFYVRAYLNSSYVVQTLSPSMTNESSDTLQPLAAATASSAGVEQFGINLVDNANPNVGSNPALQPNSTYANGQPATGYGTADLFKYVQGDVIAQNGNNPAWGQTNFTISYIANISGITDAGNYQMAHNLVAVSTF